MTLQVPKQYYFQEKYTSLDRFISYHHQIALIRSLKPQKLLLIGVGDGLVPQYLRGCGIDVTTYDIDAELQPTVVGDVRKMPFEDGSFDMVAAFEILEHLPFEEFGTILMEIRRVTRQSFVMSVPFRRSGFHFLFKFPFIHTLARRDFFNWKLLFPITFPGFAESGQHYWEIDKKNFAIEKVRHVMETYFDIQTESDPPLDSYRRFFVMNKKEKVLDNAYVKNYYNESIAKIAKEGDYKTNRWFTSPVAKFDFEQTQKTIQNSLTQSQYGSVLEIGPGDAVWTELLIAKTKQLTLVEQSSEMLSQAKAKLAAYPWIEFFHGDFQNFETDKKFDLIFASRCFEYFDDKNLAIKKISSLLSSNGQVVLITKNPLYRSLHERTNKTLHTQQISKQEMIELLQKHGLKVDAAYPCTFRWLSRYKIFRMLFGALHSMILNSNGKVRFPLLETRATESFVYIFSKQ